MIAWRRQLGLGTLAAAILCLAACTETGSLPTAPAGAPATAGWQRLWPEFGCTRLNAVWGLDADDAWAVGKYGAILHWDGRRVTMHERLTHDHLKDVGGTARDDVWAVGGETVLRWDGRRWSVVAGHGVSELEAVWCDGSDDIYVGGRIHDDGFLATVRRFDGAEWHDVPFMTPADNDRVIHLWRPGPDYPLMAATQDQVYRQVEGEFRWAEGSPTSVIDLDGDLILAGIGTRGLYRVEPDGTIAVVCDDDDRLTEATQIVVSRQPVVTDGPNVLGLSNCALRQLYDGHWWTIDDLAVPAISGADANTVFAVGSGNLFLRLAWQDWMLVAKDLVRVEGAFPRSDLVGTGEGLFAIGTHDNLIHFEGDVWRNLDEPIDVSHLHALADDRLAIWNDTELAVGDALASSWTELPPFPAEPDKGLWIDASVRPRFVTGDGQFWAFEAGAWVQLESWPGAENGTVYDFAGHAVDDLWASGHDGDDRFLKHFDGVGWSDIGLDASLIINELAVGAFTGDAYVSGWRWEWGSFEGVVRDGVLHLFDSFTSGQRGVIELSADLILSYRGNTVHQLRNDQWQPLDSPNVSQIVSLWGDLDQGLYTLAQERYLHRRDLPEAP